MVPACLGAWHPEPTTHEGHLSPANLPALRKRRPGSQAVHVHPLSTHIPPLSRGKSGLRAREDETVRP